MKHIQYDQEYKGFSLSEMANMVLNWHAGGHTDSFIVQRQKHGKVSLQVVKADCGWQVHGWIPPETKGAMISDYRIKDPDTIELCRMFRQHMENGAHGVIYSRSGDPDDARPRFQVVHEARFGTVANFEVFRKPALEALAPAA